LVRHSIGRVNRVPTWLLALSASSFMGPVPAGGGAAADQKLLKKPGEGFALDPLGPAAPDPDSSSNGF
jgi:hypothetical protein